MAAIVGTCTLRRAMGVLALAVGVNTAGVALQQRTALLTRIFERAGWYLHLALILPAWLAAAV